jgi:hypothetical protein
MILFKGTYKYVIAAALPICVNASAFAQVSVLTNRVNNNRTGANLSETILKPSNVGYGNFGKLAFKSLDGTGWTSPLIVSNINVGGQVRNVVYVATNNMDVYAFDADNFNDTAPLWRTQLSTQTKIGWGLLSSPVIDATSGTLYAVTGTLEGPPTLASSYKFRLWAVNIATGAIVAGSGQAITGSVPGTGDNTDGQGNVDFNGEYVWQRSALLLSNGYIYICFGSRGGDVRPYHGWVFSYNAQTLAQAGVFCTNPNSGQGGIWGAGCGPAADANGNVYVVTGNGTPKDPTSYLGNSVLKFSSDGTLTLTDYFTPYNTVYLNEYDLDLGVTGPVCIPGTNSLITGCKQGKLYALNTSNLGHLAQNDNEAIQAFDDEVHGSPVYYDGQNGPTIYCWGMNDYLKSFSLTNGTLSSSPTAQSTIMAAQGDPGGFLALSANSSDNTTPVLWSNMPYVGDDWNSSAVPGVLRSFNAYNLDQIWNSFTNLVDDTGYFAKNVPPVIANGKVYMVNNNATPYNRLNVYGELNSVKPQPPVNVVAEPRTGANRLFWTLNPNTTGFTIYRSTSSTTGFTAIASNVTTNSYKDTQISANKSYFYYVVATNSAGASLPSTTVAANYTKPPASASVNSSSNSLVLNGNASQSGSQINLTNGTTGAVGSAYYSTAIVPDEFSSTFTFQFNGPNVSGITFVVENCLEGNTRGSAAIGSGGAELGYGPNLSTGRGVQDSVGIKFVNGTSSTSATGIVYLGRDPSYETDSLSGTGIDFSSGHVFRAQVTYDGVTLTCVITDQTTNASVTHSYPVNILSFTSSTTAFVGFTGSADSSSEPTILSWTLSQ